MGAPFSEVHSKLDILLGISTLPTTSITNNHVLTVPLISCFTATAGASPYVGIQVIGSETRLVMMTCGSVRLVKFSKPDHVHGNAQVRHFNINCVRDAKSHFFLCSCTCG